MNIDNKNQTTITLSIQEIIDTVVEKYAKGVAGTILVSGDIYLPDNSYDSDAAATVRKSFHKDTMLSFILHDK